MDRIRVTTERLIDVGEPEGGFFDYYYEFDIIRYAEDGGATVEARTYIDEPEKVSLMGIVDREGNHHPLTRDDLNSPLVDVAITSLRSTGRAVNWLGPGGYQPVPDTRPPAPHPLRRRWNYARSVTRMKLRRSTRRL